ncbi:MAG: hypothetical protein ACPL4H_03015, partial [Anaerolineales bacterium]
MFNIMEILPIALITLITFGLGIIAGLLLADLRRSNLPLPPKEVIQKKLNQFARFWMDNSRENILLEIEGKIFHNVDELSISQRRILSDFMNTGSLVGKTPQGESESELSPPSPTDVTPAKEDSTPPSPAKSTPDSPFVNLQPPSQTAPMPKKTMLDLLARSTQPPPRPAVEVSKSIAAQVDEILQTRIQGTELEQRAIRLMELPGKGMVVMIGLDQYDSVNDVPDSEIQAVLRAAVKE